MEGSSLPDISRVTGIARQGHGSLRVCRLAGPDKIRVHSKVPRKSFPNGTALWILTGKDVHERSLRYPNSGSQFLFRQPFA
jgi:hypothetical protein